MEIFGIGLMEMVVIGVLALVILGPERLPEAARTLGKGIADVRKAMEPARSAWDGIKGEINSVTTTITAPIANLNGTPTGNPWTVHPILAQMTPEEQEKYVAGGPMPPAVQEQMSKLDTEHRNGHSGEEQPMLDYTMPHSELRFQPAIERQIEDISYPEPGGNHSREGGEKKDE